jgi:hypothetical protein
MSQVFGCLLIPPGRKWALSFSALHIVIEIKTPIVRDACSLGGNQLACISKLSILFLSIDFQ